VLWVKRAETPDPTTLLIIDEANRLKTAGLEQVRDIFDQGSLGVVLVGMPGILLHRLLTLMARLVEINALSEITREVVNTVRENLVIGVI
jgi:hypothetical protein